MILTMKRYVQILSTYSYNLAIGPYRENVDQLLRAGIQLNQSSSFTVQDIRNTIGNVPREWYDEYRHLGYDWDGKKNLKPEKGDQLDYFLKQAEDPNFW